MELNELEDAITNMLMADSKELLNSFTIIAISLILKLRDQLQNN